MNSFWIFVSDPHIAGLATLLGVFLGIIGPALGLYFYKKTKNSKFIKYTSRSYFLAGKHDVALPQNLEFFYNGIRVERVAKTIFHIWNGGNTTINGTCISTLDPLKIKLEDEQAIILSSDIFFETRKTIAPSLTLTSVSKNEIEIVFDFMDENDGFSIEILHTGNLKSSSLSGTIKGQNFNIKCINFNNFYSNKRISFFGYNIKQSSVSVFIGVFYFIVGIIGVILNFYNFDKESKSVLRATLPLVMSLVGVVAISLSLYKGGIPKSFLVADLER